MRRKVIVVAGVGIVLAAALVVGGAAVSGYQTKKALQAAAARLPMLRVVDQKYSRGLFSSTQTLTLQVGCAASASQPAFTLRQRIKHGPFPGFSSVGTAVIDSELLVPDEARKVFDEITGGQPPLTAHSVLGFGGSVRSQVAMPAFHFRGPKGELMSFQGLQADVRSQGDTVVYDLALPGLNIAAKDERMALEMRLAGVKMHGDFAGAGSLWLWPGKSAGEIGSLEISAMSQVASPVPPMRLALSQLKASTETTLAEGLVTSTTRLAGQGMAGSVKLDKIELQASLKRLHAATYERIMRRAMEGAVNCDAEAAAATPQVLLQQLQQDLVALLPYGPEYALDKLALEIDGKRGELSYAIGVSGVTEADAQLPLAALLLGKAKVRGQANLPAVWVENTLASFGGAKRDAAAQAEMMNVMLAKLAADGYVVRDGDMLNTQFVFDQGQLLINGKALAH